MVPLDPDRGTIQPNHPSPQTYTFTTKLYVPPFDGLKLNFLLSPHAFGIYTRRLYPSFRKNIGQVKLKSSQSHLNRMYRGRLIDLQRDLGQRPSKMDQPLWIISLDLSKTFDRVNWESLWQAVGVHGVSQHLVWIL